MESTVLVTGADGFVGSHLTARLLERGEHARALIVPHADGGAIAALGAELVRGDIRDRAAMERAVSGCRVVYHLAGRAPPVPGSAADFFADNVDGTRSVAQAAVSAGVERLVFASSTSVYGVRRDRAINEQTSTRPDSRYRVSKLLAERALLEYHARDALPVSIARLPMVFGARSTSWAGLFQAIASGNFRLIGSGGGIKHPGAVEDIVDGMLLCAERAAAGRVYLLSGPERVSLRRMLELIAREVGGGEIRNGLPVAPLRLYKVASNLVPAAERDRLPRFDQVQFFLADTAYDLSRAQHELGYSPRVGVAETIRDTAESYRARGVLDAPR